MSNLEKIFIGMDESNNGNHKRKCPEIFVSVFSENPLDIKKSNFNKRRDLIYNPFEKLGMRDYSFCTLDKGLRKNYKEKDMQGLIASSLILPFSKSNQDRKYDIYLDGKKKPSEIEQIGSMISSYCEIPEKDISLYSGRELDEHIFLVNLADSIAYQLFRKSSLRRKNKHKVPFLY